MHKGECFLALTFTVAPGDLEEKHLQRDNLKGIDSRHKNNFQSMRSSKGAKHYLVIVKVKDSFLMMRNQREELSCNDNTQSLRNKNYRLEYQPTEKSDTPEDARVKEMEEAGVPVGDN